MRNLNNYVSFMSPDYWTVHKGPELAEYYKYPIFYSCLLYFPLVWIGQKYMRNRPPIKLKYTAVIWNCLLGSLSMLGSYLILRYDGNILLSFFYPESNYTAATRAVTSLFTLTKAIEFGDTFILVCKKKPISFLHLYHHFSVTLYCWHAQAVNVAFGHHFAFINLCIHSVMYTYFGLSVIFPGNRLLGKCRPYITISQTLQMMIGGTISYASLSSPFLLEEHRFNAQLALAMYISYAILFAKLFIENYKKQYRPNLTLFVGGIHFLAFVGVCLVWRHDNIIRLIIEVLLGYFLTALLVYLTEDYPSSSKSLSNLSRCDSSYTLQFCLIAARSICRLALLLLNCIAAWLKDHTVARFRSEFMDPAAAESLDSQQKVSNSWVAVAHSEATTPEEMPQVNSLNGSFVNQEDSIDYQKTLNNCLLTSQSNASISAMNNPNTVVRKARSTPNLQKRPHHSVLRSYLQKVDLSVNSVKSSKSWFKQLSGLDTTSLNFPPSSLKDIWLVAICCVTPAIYGLNIYGDFFLGLCVHGALRWVLELHTTDSILRDYFSDAVVALKKE